MKSLSQHIQETLKNGSLKEVLVEKLVDEKLDTLHRIAPAEIVGKVPTKSLVDTAVGIES